MTGNVATTTYKARELYCNIPLNYNVRDDYDACHMIIIKMREHYNKDD